MKLKKTMIIFLSLILGASFSGCSNTNEDNNKQVKISTQKVTKGNLRIGLIADGRINLSLTNLNFEVAGIVEKINVSSGDMVKKGDVLAELDDTDLRQAVTKANNSYKKAKANYNDALIQREINIMNEKLNLDDAKAKMDENPEDDILKTKYELEKKRYDNLVNNNSSVENAKLNLDEAKSDLAATNENLRKVVLKAPFDGKIISIAYKIGEYVDNSKTGNSSSSAFMVLCNPNDIFMTTSVTEGDIKGLAKGQNMIVSVESAELDNLKGQVTDVNSIPKIDNSGIVSYEVTGKLDEANEAIMDGMSCIITFLKKEKNDVLIIPNKAVFVEEGKQYVNVQLEDETIEKKEVLCGLSNGTQTEVVEGLKEGETVVIGGVKK